MRHHGHLSIPWYRETNKVFSNRCIRSTGRQFDRHQRSHSRGSSILQDIRNMKETQTGDVIRCRKRHGEEHTGRKTPCDEHNLDALEIKMDSAELSLASGLSCDYHFSGKRTCERIVTGINCSILFRALKCLLLPQEQGENGFVPESTSKKWEEIVFVLSKESR